MRLDGSHRQTDTTVMEIDLFQLAGARYIYIYITRVDRELIVFHGPMCTVSRNVESIESQLSFETRSVDRCNLGVYSINGHGDVLIEYSWNEAYDILVGLS